MAQLTGDVAAALEQLNVAAPFALVGHSFGGAIAAEYTAANPSKVSRLVVIATPGEFHLRTYYKFLLALPYALHGIIAPFVKNWVGAPPGVMKSLYYNTLREWRGWDTFAKVTIPTLLIRGKNDRIYADVHFRKVATAFPNAKALTLNGGHMVMVTRGDSVNKAIRRFIEPEKHPKANSEQQGNGKPLLLLHGMGSSLRAWDALLPALHEAGYATYALDLLGHGDSARFGADDASIELYYRHFTEWLDEMDLPHPITILAHSMGSYLALSYALRNPGAVRQLVLVDPFYKPAQLSPWLRATTRRARLSSGVMRRAPRWLVHTSVRLNRNIAAGLSRTVTKQMAADYQRMDPRITHTPASTEDLTDLLPQINTKTLVIWGKRDQTLAPVSFPGLLELLPNAIGLPIRGAGHTPHMTHSAQVSRAVLNFLEG
jgi:pimeloyl-ACP methyl ester carboxylesterase